MKRTKRETPKRKRRRSHVKGTCYLLHFNTPLAHARHYLGWTEGEVKIRIEAHRSGRGARLMEVVVEAGITFRLAKTWKNVDRFEERRLKNLGGHARVCPICKAEA